MDGGGSRGSSPGAGQQLGRYQVIRHIASGGMADVLLARAQGIEGFERHVVLKRIRSEHAKDERFIKMFLDEARLAASLHHQNVVQVHDIGEEGGEYFFAMEYIHGADLRSVLHRVVRSKQQVPLAIVVAIGSAVAAGLHYAHERKGADGKSLGIVHRDVSLSNILIGYDGSVRVVDFGIAKAAARSIETRSGTLKGKVAYMSPEQCMGKAIDRRSDVWGIGVVLYELATASRLFTGDTDYVIMNTIVSGNILSPTRRRADLPGSLARIIQRALTADPTKRYQTAGEMRVALDKFATDSGIVSSATSIADWLEGLFGNAGEPWLGDESQNGFSGVLDASSIGERSTSVERPAGLGAGTGVEELPDTRNVARPTTASGERPARTPSGSGERASLLGTEPTAPGQLPPSGVTSSSKPSGTNSLAWNSIAKPPAGMSPGMRLAIAIGAGVFIAGLVIAILELTKDPPPAGAPPPAPTAAAQLPAETVRQVAATNEAAALRGCQGDSPLSGAVALQLVVDPDGRVTGATTTSSTIDNPKVVACLEQAVRGWTFPARPGQPTATAAYSIEFK